MKLAKRWGRDLPDVGLKMTSMIDVVFLLIIFFMCVTEMSKQETESMTLPQAQKGREDTRPTGASDRMIVNVMKDGTYRVMYRTYSRDELKNLMMRRAVEKTDAQGLSLLAVKIRCDAYCPYKYAQQVMMMCMNAKIWQVSFGVAPQQPGMPAQ